MHTLETRKTQNWKSQNLIDSKSKLKLKTFKNETAKKLKNSKHKNKKNKKFRK